MLVALGDFGRQAACPGINENSSDRQWLVLSVLVPIAIT